MTKNQQMKLKNTILLISSRKSFVSIISLFMLLNISSAFGQWYGSVNIDNYYDNNIFRMNSPEAVFINSNSLFVGLAPDSANYAMSYRGAFILTDRLPDLQYHSHNLGFSYSARYGESNQNKVDFILKGTARFNSGVYEDYNNTSIRGGIKSKHKWTPTLMSIAGYEMKIKDYSVYDDLSYNEHILTVGLKKFFETKTSVHLNANYSLKSYGTIASSLFAGKGGNRTESNSIDQVSASVKIAQSLFEKTGLSVEYKRKLNLTSDEYSGSISYIDYFMETELYDDPYSYASNELKVTLTQMLPNNLKLQAMGFYYDKEYSYLAENLSDLRSDTQAGLVLSAKKKFTDDWAFLYNPTIGLHYYYIDNTSNLGYFQYSSSSVNLSFSANF